jgi:hypothetical protein
MIYLTFGDQPSGVYQSQVLDVCKYINQNHSGKIKLIAFFSLRGFFKTRALIKKNLPNAIVLPAFPGIRRWKYNLFTLRIVLFFIGSNNFWCRGIFATQLALKLRQKGICKSVVFDARGAYSAEHQEYLSQLINIRENYRALEKDCVLNADYRLAVSEALTHWWKQEFGYTGREHCVIPCNLGASHQNDFPAEKEIMKWREKAAYSSADVVLVYSGSNADWQSSAQVDAWLLKLMDKDPSVKLLLLANQSPEHLTVFKKYPSRVAQNWVPAEKVRTYLLMADYGILLREQTITNRVASPTKYAEYLSAGLQVLISNNLGDFSDFTGKHHCGIVIDESEIPQALPPVNYLRKRENHELALRHFTRENHAEAYAKILGILSAS